MEPRYRNAKAILVRSFARIHETNLKKQGVLPLTFADPATYDDIGEDDTISILGLADLAPDKPVPCRIHHADGTTTDFEGLHTMSPEHIDWFRAGGALNVIRANPQELRRRTTTRVQPGATTRPRPRSLRSRPRECRRPRALRWQPSATV